MIAKEMARDVFSAIRGYVQRSISPLVQRLEALERRPDSALRELTSEERKALVESLFPYMEASHQKWALDFERNATQLMLKAVSAIPEPEPGKDGKDGCDGVDGLGFDDMTVERTGPRTFAMKFQRGDRVKEFPLSFPVVLDAGVWEEKEYEAGDGTSHSGCFWIAQEKTTEKPGTGKAWRMAVKKGRDGKDGSAGPVGPKGTPGVNGRNYDGSKAY